MIKHCKTAGMNSLESFDNVTATRKSLAFQQEVEKLRDLQMKVEMKEAGLKTIEEQRKIERDKQEKSLDKSIQQF